MTYGMDDGRYWWNDAERLNQLERDVFWLRWCRQADEEDREDMRRLDEIRDWIARTAGRLPSENATEYGERLSTVRAINELQQGAK
jgi:hypothetical protein